MQPIETVEEYEELQRVDLSAHEPIVIEPDEDDDELALIDANH